MHRQTHTCTRTHELMHGHTHACPHECSRLKGLTNNTQILALHAGPGQTWTSLSVCVIVVCDKVQGSALPAGVNTSWPCGEGRRGLGFLFRCLIHSGGGVWGFGGLGGRACEGHQKQKGAELRLVSSFLTEYSTSFARVDEASEGNSKLAVINSVDLKTLPTLYCLTLYSLLVMAKFLFTDYILTDLRLQQHENGPFPQISAG